MAGPTEIPSPVIAATANIGTPPFQAPSLFAEGVSLYDPRYAYKYGAAGSTNALTAIGIGPCGMYLVVDQVPATAHVDNISTAANPSSGTAVTLVNGTAGSGITKLASALTITQTGNVVPSANLVIDGNPALVTYGTYGAVAMPDPTTTIARAITITGGSSTATGGNVKIVGYDLYGNLVHETLAVVSQTATTTSNKIYKFIQSVTPQYTDTNTISVGTSDTYGFPIAVNTWGYTLVNWNATLITASTGFTGANTGTATASSTDVRGSYALQSNTSNGTRRLTMWAGISSANLSSTTGIFGVAQFSS